MGSVNDAVLTITKSSKIGIIIHFPTEYAGIWNQIPQPSALNFTTGTSNFSTTDIRLTTRYLFAVFEKTMFTSQVNFTSFKISFMFRNPNKTVDCTVLPVFTVSLFDFKGKSIYAQTLSNNEVCPTFTTRLYEINVTGNTKISAGSSSPFYVTLEKPAKNLTITPLCESSAISFRPASITF